MYQGFYLFVRLFNKYNIVLTSEIEYNFWYAKRINISCQMVKICCYYQLLKLEFYKSCGWAK